MATLKFPPKANFWLGNMYRMGQSVPQNYTAAIKWYRKAADQGHADAQFELGRIYRKGAGVPQDYAETVRWFRMAADQGNPFAQSILGTMYYKGQGVPQDFILAHMWFNLAAAQGSLSAQKGRDEAARKMTPAQIDEAQRLAEEWEQKKGKD